MTIIVGDQVIIDLPDSVSEFYERYPSLKTEASKLVLKLPKTIEHPQGVVYVTQKEYALVERNDSRITVVGTDDATTCHILVIFNKEESRFILAHVDNANNVDMLSRMIVDVVGSSCFRSDDFHLELSIFGGYDDEMKQSECLTTGLLEFFHELNVNIKLQALCVGSANTQLTNGINFPCIYGMAVDVSSFSIYPAKFTSKVRGPCLPMRACRFFCSQNPLYRVYDSKNGVMEIEPFNYRAPIHQINKWLLQSDEFILKNFSTSPSVEPEHFVREMRQVFQFVAQNPFPMYSIFKGNNTLRFSLSSQGEWQKL